MLLFLFSLLSHVRLFTIPWAAAYQASMSLTISSLPKFMSIESVMPSTCLTLCHPLLFLPSIFPSIRVFSNEESYDKPTQCVKKSKDITLPTKVCIVKAMVFPVVVYGCTFWVVSMFSSCSSVAVNILYISPCGHVYAFY